MGNRPPHTFRPGLASSPMHPLTLTPSSIWLLFILIKKQPPKAKALPLSLLFDASYFASPSKQTNDSKRNPDGLQPAHGIGERWLHNLVVPLLYPWRERGQSCWRVGWHGSSCWLLCLRVLCFVFCAASKTIRSSRVSPYLIFWKMKNMRYVFWRVPTFVDQIMTGKKGTVIWPLVGINLRWPFVVSKYKHHQSHFNLRKILLGFFILQKQWDPNFLLLCISFLLCIDLQPYGHDRFSKNIKNFLCK